MMGTHITIAEIRACFIIYVEDLSLCRGIEVSG